MLPIPLPEPSFNNKKSKVTSILSLRQSSMMFIENIIFWSWTSVCSSFTEGVHACHLFKTMNSIAFRRNNQWIWQWNKFLKISHLYWEKFLFLFAIGKINCDNSKNNAHPYVPPPFRKIIYQHFHSISHPGNLASLKLTADTFFWPSINKEDIRTWNQQCQTNNLVKKKNRINFFQIFILISWAPYLHQMVIHIS